MIISIPGMGVLHLNMAESPVSDGTLWVGTNDGLLHITTDGGKNWINVTKNIALTCPMEVRYLV